MATKYIKISMIQITSVSLRAAWGEKQQSAQLQDWVSF